MPGKSYFCSWQSCKAGSTCCPNGNIRMLRLVLGLCCVDWHGSMLSNLNHHVALHKHFLLQNRSANASAVAWERGTGVNWFGFNNKQVSHFLAKRCKSKIEAPLILSCDQTKTIHSLLFDHKGRAWHKRPKPPRCKRCAKAK
jgi:hypothetical protein